MNSDKNLIKRIEKIEERNAKVSLDKRREGSWTRKVAIAIFTYFIVLVYLFVIGNENPWINAIVPPVGFILSTLAIGWLRTYWQNRVESVR